MQLESLKTEPTGLTATTARRAYHILVLYEDAAASMRALEFDRWLARSLDRGIDMQRAIWKFDLLEQPVLRQRAASEAISSDMIVIAARGMSELPVSIQNWFQEWLPRKRSGLATLVSIPDVSEESCVRPPRLCAFLRQVAEGRGIGFFCHACCGPWSFSSATHSPEVSNH